MTTRSEDEEPAKVDEPSPPTPRDALPDRYFDLYRMAVEQVDHISSRRATANLFFAGLHATVLTVVGLIRPVLVAATPPPYDPLPTVTACVGGIVLAGVWWLALRSYRDLNGAKFNVILDMEKRLPARIFTDEWKTLKEDSVRSWRRRYAEISLVEQVVPVIFIALYLLVLWSVWGRG